MNRKERALEQRRAHTCGRCLKRQMNREYDEVRESSCIGPRTYMHHGRHEQGSHIYIATTKTTSYSGRHSRI
eukprot:234356-Pleurochrysis_carterae.AAC.3